MKKKRGGREQARSAQSRQAVIEAVVRLINRHGYAGATATNIARESGLSTGVIQYQFGGKDELLKAVLLERRRRLLAALAEDRSPFSGLEEAVDHVLDRLWLHYRDPYYRATLEILTNSGPLDDSWAEDLRHMRNRVIDALQQLLAPHCPGADSHSLREVIALAMSALRGISVGNAIPRDQEGGDAPATELATLRRLLLTYLQSTQSREQIS